MTLRHPDRILRPIIYGTWALFFLFLVVSGQARLFVRPAFLPLLSGAAVLLIMCVAMEAFRPDLHSHIRLTGTAAILFLAPLLWALCARPQGLPASIAPTRTGGTVRVDPAELLRTLQDTAAMEGRYRRLTIKHIVAAARERGPAIDGMPVSTEGFLVQDSGGWRLVRFLITCCAADATALTIPVTSGAPPPAQPDVWVIVRGTVHIHEGKPIIVADGITVKQPPRNPYLY